MSSLAPAHRTDNPIPSIVFAAGLPGFPNSREFALVRWAAEGPFSVLVDLANQNVRFLVVPPMVFFPDYGIELPDDLVARLELLSPDEVLLLAIVSLGDEPMDATANLLGPLVINIRTRQGEQTVLVDSGWTTKVPLAGDAA